jgi:hypothetical protein
MAASSAALGQIRASHPATATTSWPLAAGGAQAKGQAGGGALCAACRCRGSWQYVWFALWKSDDEVGSAECRLCLCFEFALNTGTGTGSPVPLSSVLWPLGTGKWEMGNPIMHST